MGGLPSVGAVGNPNPVAGSSPAASKSCNLALCCKKALVAVAFPCHNFAANPLTCGVAMEVPEITA